MLLNDDIWGSDNLLQWEAALCAFRMLSRIPGFYTLDLSIPHPMWRSKHPQALPTVSWWTESSQIGNYYCQENIHVSPFSCSALSLTHFPPTYLPQCAISNALFRALKTQKEARQHRIHLHPRFKEGKLGSHGTKSYKAVPKVFSFLAPLGCISSARRQTCWPWERSQPPSASLLMS